MHGLHDSWWLRWWHDSWRGHSGRIDPGCTTSPSRCCWARDNRRGSWSRGDWLLFLDGRLATQLADFGDIDVCQLSAQRGQQIIDRLVVQVGNERGKLPLLPDHARLVEELHSRVQRLVWIQVAAAYGHMPVTVDHVCAQSETPGAKDRLAATSNSKASLKVEHGQLALGTFVGQDLFNHALAKSVDARLVRTHLLAAFFHNASPLSLRLFGLSNEIYES